MSDHHECEERILLIAQPFGSADHAYSTNSRRSNVPRFIETREKWEEKKDALLAEENLKKKSAFIENVIKSHDDFRAYHRDRREIMKKLCKDVRQC